MAHHVAFATEIRKTRELFDAYLNVHNKKMADKTWDPMAQMIANVFNAYPIRTFTLEHMTNIIIAVEALTVEDREAFNARAKSQLSKMVRAKTLRSRYDTGKHLYEVNF